MRRPRACGCSGVDLRQELDEATVQAIRQALLKYKVLFFREQHIDHPHEDAPPEGFPEIFPIDSRRYEKKFGKRKVTYDNGWHTDVTAVVNPPFESILKAATVPTFGGDTQWTNLVAAYENLPEELRYFADTLRAKHSFAPLGAPDSDWVRKIANNPLVAIHPVVRVHPETGERALYVGPTFTRFAREIIGFSARQSGRILELFWEEITKSEYTVRFRWEAGSIAFWDNRSTAHLAPSDPAHLDNGNRILYRVTLEGMFPWVWTAAGRSWSRARNSWRSEKPGKGRKTHPSRALPSSPLSTKKDSAMRQNWRFEPMNRRALSRLLLAAPLALTACGREDAKTSTSLRIGDQGKSLQLPFELAGQTTGAPRRLEWTTFTDGPNMTLRLFPARLTPGRWATRPRCLLRLPRRASSWSRSGRPCRTASCRSWRATARVSAG